MGKELSLTLAFLNQRPVAAGRALTEMSADDAAEFLNSIPTRSAAPVLAAMGVWPASAVLRKMSTVSAAAIIGTIDYLDATAILRSLTAAVRQQILSELPERLRRDFETTIAFPESTIGAHMSTAFMTLSKEHSVQDGIECIRRSSSINPDVILIVDEDRKLKGSIDASALLRHASDARLGDIMDRGRSPVLARSSIASMEGFAGWKDYSVLPVLSRQKRLIGILARKTLAHANTTHSEHSTAAATLPVAMLDAFVASAAGLTRLLTGTEKGPAVKTRNTHE